MNLRIRVLAGLLDSSAGSHVYNRELIRRLAARGYHVSVVCFKTHPSIPPEVEVHEVHPYPYHEVRFIWRMASFLQHRLLSRSLRRLNLAPPDIVVGCEHLLLRAHHREFPGVPWIYLPHSLTLEQEFRTYCLPPVMEWTSLRVYTSIQRWALNCANRTMRFTRRGCEVLSSTYGESIHPRFVVNPPGIDAPEICGRPGTGEAVRLLCVARLVPSKRISLILNALASFARYRWSLDIVGDGVCRQDLERQARQQGLEERIRFHGHQEALGPCYWQADLFLFPSELENCSLAMLEAMSYAVPCLAMKDDGVRFRNSNSEIIRDGIDGFLAASDEEFTTRLGSLLQEPSRILHAGMAARDHILAEHSWDEHLDVYEGLFLKLEKERRPISTRLCPSM